MTNEEKVKAYDEALKRAKEAAEKGMVSHNFVSDIFPELKESEDGEKIRKVLIKGFQHYDKECKWGEFTTTEILAWLEKQGEKTSDKAEPKFKVGDVIKNIDNGDTVKIEQILDNYYCYSGWDGAASVHSDFSISEQDGWELVEQKPADKVEPKFKVGDWVVENITNGIFVGKITSINTCFYGVDGLDGNWYHIDFFEEEQMHLWTVKDAKPGDVIYLPNGGNEYFLFIFKGIENAAVMSFVHFYQYNDGTSEVEGTTDKLSSVNDVFQPATKEQRELLFAKMKEAGYKWDAEKKELTKIEQSHASKKYTFNAIPRLLGMVQPTDKAKAYCQKLIGLLIQEGYGADAKIVGNCLKQMNGEKVAMATINEQKPEELPKGEDYAIDGLWQAIQILEHSLGEVDGWQSDDGILEHKCAIEAVNRLYKQKPTWSEDDERICRCLIKDQNNELDDVCKDRYGHSEIVSDLKKIYRERINWLKSLKEKFQ